MIRAEDVIIDDGRTKAAPAHVALESMDREAPQGGDEGSRPVIDEEQGAQSEARLPKLKFTHVPLWSDKLCPERRWLVRDRIPMGNVSLLLGNGGIGKTTIALQLAVATVLGTEWLGAPIEEPGQVLFFSGEESDEEIEIRLRQIAGHCQLNIGDFGGLHVQGIPDEETILGLVDKTGVVKATSLFKSLERTAIEMRPALIVIEAAANIFAGDENDRSQVRQFISLLRRLAIKSDSAVLLIAHPSLSGMATGSGTSGSTQWHNSVRSRMYFAEPHVKRDEEIDPDLREFKVKKNNFGRANESLQVRWNEGAFAVDGGPSALERKTEEAAIDAAYLACLDAKTACGLTVGPATGRSYAPSAFEKMEHAKPYKSKALAAAQERLFAAGKIVVVKVGPPSRAKTTIVRKVV